MTLNYPMTVERYPICLSEVFCNTSGSSSAILSNIKSDSCFSLIPEGILSNARTTLSMQFFKEIRNARALNMNERQGIWKAWLALYMNERQPMFCNSSNFLLSSWRHFTALASGSRTISSCAKPFLLMASTH